MSGLDGQVKHLLEPMMLGKPRTLTPEEQLTIATWAAIKSMVLEYVWGSEQVCLPQAARTFVFRQQRPPESMQIRIAAVESQGRPALIFRRVYQLQPTPLQQRSASWVCLLLDLRARLLVVQSSRDLDCFPCCFAAPAWAQLLRHKPADWVRRQLATFGATRRCGP